MDKTNWKVKSYHYFMVYLPVFCIFGLILLIYLSYILTYILVLINTPNDILDTIDVNKAKEKGQLLLIITLIFTIMLLLSLIRTIIVDPGYFPSPINLELKIINKNNKSNINYSYLTNIHNDISISPLTNTEYENIRYNISQLLPNTKYEYNPYTNEDIFNKNKKEYMEEYNRHINSYCYNTKEDIFIDIYNGIDLTKTNLCGTCLRLKVERSHHCRQCGRCILKMDHHCPWLANCIGFNNYKSFCLTHLYGVICTTIIAITYWEVIINYNLNYYSNILQCWYVIFIYISNLGLLGFLMWLLLVNINLTFTGQTVIEQSDRERFPSSRSKNIYDMGWRRNFTNIFGRNPLLWFIPFYYNDKGKGLVFETNDFIID